MLSNFKTMSGNKERATIISRKCDIVAKAIVSPARSAAPGSLSPIVENAVTQLEE
jgi:hypothetical protein